MFYLFPTFSYSIANYIRLMVWMAVIWKNALAGDVMYRLELPINLIKTRIFK